MAHLTEESTYEELKMFLLYHMDQADERPAKSNPSITKEDYWNIMMGGAMNESPKVKTMLMRKSIKEFGSYYENEEENKNE